MDQYQWEARLQNLINVGVTDGFGNSCTVDTFEDLFVFSWGDNSIREVFGDKDNVSGVEGLLHFPWPLRLGHHLMGDVEVLQRVRQKLRAEHLKVGTHLEDLRLGVEVVNGSHHVVSSDDAKRRILDNLESSNGRFTGIREPDWRRVVDDGENQALERDEQCLLLLTPGGTS